MNKCEHKTQTILRNAHNLSVSLCDWGCDKVLIHTKQSNGYHELDSTHATIEGANARLQELSGDEDIRYMRLIPPDKNANRSQVNERQRD